MKRSIVGVILFSGAIAAGCNGGTTADAGDAADTGADVVTDLGVDSGMDTGADVIDATTDTANDTATDGGTDVPTDVVVDPRTFDPMHFYYYYQTARLGFLDTSNAGGMVGEVSPFPVMSPMSSPTDVIAPDDMSGGCIYHAQRLTGDQTRNDALDVDYGTLTFTQPGGISVNCTIDPMYGTYGCDSSMATTLNPNAPTTLTITGSADAGTTMTTSTVDFPPPIMPSNVHLPTMFSSTTDSMITWDVPAGATPDLAAAIVMFDMTRANVTICVAHATDGHLTVPHSLMAHYLADGGTAQANAAVSFERLRFVRQSSGIDVDFRVETGVVSLVTVQ